MTNRPEPVESTPVKLQTWAESVKSLEKEKQQTSTPTQSAGSTPSQTQLQGTKSKSTPQQVLARVHQLLEVIYEKYFYSLKVYPVLAV